MRTDGTRNSLNRLAILGMFAVLALALALATQVQASAMAAHPAQPQASIPGQDTSLQSRQIERVVQGNFVAWSVCSERQAVHFSGAGQSAEQVNTYAAELEDDDDDDGSAKVLAGGSFIANGTRVGSNPPGFVFSGTAVRYHTRR
jgi:hypothetical protein